MADTLAEALRDEVLRLLGAVRTAVENPDGSMLLLRAIGYTDVVAGRSDLATLVTRLGNAAASIDSLDPGNLEDWRGLADLLQALGEASAAIAALSSTDVAGLGRELADALVVGYVRDRFPRLFRVACLLDLIEPAEAEATAAIEWDGDALVRVPPQRDRLHFERVRQLISDPKTVLTSAYLPGGLVTAANAHAAAARVFPLLARLAGALGAPTRTDLADTEPPGPPPDPGADPGPSHLDVEVVDDGGDPPPPAPADLTLYLRRFLPRLSVALPALSGGGADFGLEVTASSDEHPDPVAGFIVALTGTPALAQDRGGWHLELNASGDVPAFVVGADGVALAPGAGAVSGEVHLVMRRIALPGEPAFRLGSTTGTRLELGTASVSVDLRLGPERSAISVAFDTAPSALILAPGDGDGFLRAILANDARLTLDLGAILSTDWGLKLKGGVGLSSRSPATLSLGPLTVSGSTLGVSVGAASVRLDATCDLSLALGPVRVGVAGIGMGFDVGVPEVRDGWPVSLDTDFVPPTGATLAIDAGPVRGGGFLHREAARYHGGLALDAFGLALSAIGVLDTTGTGYSLVAVVSAEFHPIPIGFGFTLDGVGGLVGINRRVDVEALRAAVRGPGIGDIFFPADPVAQAARLTGDLASFFPAAGGRHVFGPAVRLGWGTPRLVRATLVLLLEVPSPVRLVLLGTASAALPTEDAPIVELNVDVVGEVDFARKTLAIDASLRDSKVAGFSITGDMAMRMAWGDAPSFALSVGGFHSQFRRPPGFPELRRVQIPIGSGENPRLDIKGFLALTSNTAQIGAEVDLYAAAGPLNIVGNVGFEALLQFVPFEFRADLWAGVALRRGTRVLASVHLDGTLRGPTPWHFAGEACLSLWFVDLCVGFDATFGPDRTVELPARDIWPPLEAALEDPRNWSSALPPAAGRAVTTAAPSDDDTRIDPASALAVRQKIVPLNRTIERFAHVPPSGLDRFHVSSAMLGTTVFTAPSLIEDWFAAGQFEALTDDERLSRPGFEKMVAGVTMASDRVTTGPELTKPLEYETIKFPDPAPLPGFYQPTLLFQLDSIATGKNATAPLRAAAPPVPLVMLEEELYVIAATLDLAPRLDIVGAVGRGEAERSLDGYLLENPAARGALQVVPRFEII